MKNRWYHSVGFALQFLGGMLLVVFAAEALGPGLTRLLQHWPAWMAAGMLAGGTVMVHRR